VFNIYFFLGMVAFWSILLTIIFRIEKRMVWPYGELEPAPQVADPDGYALTRVTDAVGAGFTLLGWARDLKGSKYRISYAMLFSPERDAFVVIGIGTVINIPMATTWIYTPTSDGRCFYSTDKQAGVQLDLSANWTNQLVPSTTFLQLFEAHRAWTQSHQVIPRPLMRGRELAEFRALREQHYRHMERAGLIDFIDPSATWFQFTLSGAAKTAVTGYFLGMARQLSQVKDCELAEPNIIDA
jgi:hypothetical protein